MLNNRIVCLLLFCVGIIAASGFAQVTTGTISGVVKDESGAVLPGAAVTVRNLETGMTRNVTSDNAGRYRALQLSLGTYEVQASLAGFKTEVKSGVVLTVGKEAVLDFMLGVGEVTEQVTVTAEAPLLETTSASVTNLVDERQIRDLPLNARSLEQFAFLMPAITAQRHYSGSLNSGITPKISVAGARTDQNVYLLDGTDVNDYAGATPGSVAGTMAGVETIREYQVLTHNYGAEYGRSTGAVLSMVTRSGSNEFHGSLFEFLRNDVLDARNFFDRTTPPFRRNQFGGLLSGPIARDSTFFMGSYEVLRQRLGVTNTSFVPDENARLGILPDPQNPGGTSQVSVSPAVKPYLDLYPRPNGRNVGGGVAEFVWPYSILTDQDYVTTRVDHRLNSNHSLFGRYTLDDARVVNPLTFPFFLDRLNSRNQYTTVAETSILSPRAVNDFRIAFNRMAPTNTSGPTINIDPSLDFVPGQGPGLISFSASAINIRGGVGALSLIGPSTRTPGRWIRNIYQVLDSLSYVAGSHSFKFGGNFERLQTNNQQPTNRAGAYTFASLLEFLPARPARFDASEGSAITGWRQSLISMYVHDDYKLKSNLTLNMGLRYEFVTLLKEAHGRARNLDHLSDLAMRTGDSFLKANPSLRSVAPRFGLAWQPFARTAVRLGVGLYYHQLMDRPLIFLPQGNSTDSNRFTVISPSFPRVASFPPGSAGASTIDVTTNPRSIHYSFNIQQEISPATTFTIGYMGTQGRHILHFAEANIANPTILPDGSKFFPAGARRRNPNFGQIRLVATDSNSLYNGLTLKLERRFAEGLQGGVSYTFAKSIDEGSSTSSGDILNESQGRNDPDNAKAERGLSGFDQRQNFVLNFTLDLPMGPAKLLGGNVSGVSAKLLQGWQFSGILTAQTGTPFTPLVSFNRSRNLDQGNDRPNRKAGATNVPILGTPERWFDVGAAFELQPAGFYGNAGRNIITGPNLHNLDVALIKNTSITERVNLQFRFEVFNLFNRTNFSLPTNNLFSSDGSILGTAGRITKTDTASRQLQAGLKLVF